jgi:FkbM family methyltransferase
MHRTSAVTTSAKNALFLAVVLVVVMASIAFGVAVGRHYQTNVWCCKMPNSRNLVLSFKETLGVVSFPSQIGQDKWVLETVFPDVRDGFFVDVGSGDGIVRSNTYSLERRGWTGICIDPFPTNMQGRTCRVFKEVVYGEAGKRVLFHTAGEIGGVAETLDTWKRRAETSPAVEFTTVTLGDILERANAPSVIHFMSLDIEGAELEALRGVPFDKYSFGALAIEHNYEGRKRNDIEIFLERHGYSRVHTWFQDDFFVRAPARVREHTAARRSH